MKHKNFNKLFPYGYFLIRKSDNKKYVGIRYANVKYNLTPEEDFGRVYFTSGGFKKEFKEYPENFEFRLCYTFDSIDELFEWERKIALRIYKRSDWENQGWGQNYGDNPEIGRLISAGKNQKKSCGKTSVEIGREKLKDWIWNTEEGGHWREDISKRQKEAWENRSSEVRKEIARKRSMKMDFKGAAAKASVTLSQVGEDGLTGRQRSARKAAVTSRENGIFSKIGKDRDNAFKKKLSEMSEEQFNEYLAGRPLRFVNNCITKRQKYLNEIGKE